MSKISYDYFKECIKAHKYSSIKMTEVFERDSTLKDIKKRIPSFLYNTYHPVNVSFGNGTTEQYLRYKTIQIDLEKFKEELIVEAKLRGVQFVEKDLKNQEEVLNLKEKFIFNCMGWKSK